MRIDIRLLIAEHRKIEVELDRFGEGLAEAATAREEVQALRALLGGHYGRESVFLEQLREHEPRFADKLTEQHAEALELADRLEESLTAGEGVDALYLMRRLLAIARHNMIEEERDAFPLAERCFGAEDSRR